MNQPYKFDDSTISLILDVLNTIDTGILIHANGSILYTNSALAGLLEVPAQIVEPHQPIDDFLKFCTDRGDLGEDKSTSDLYDAFHERDKTNSFYELDRTLPSGRMIKSRSNITKAGIVIVIYSDVTEIRRSVKDAQSANRAESEFLANMSHEIRTPMNGIMGVCDLLMQRENCADEELLSIVHRSGNALLTIINDILDFSKIESGQMELSPEPFDLRSSIEDVTALLATAKQDNGVDVLVRYQPGLHSSFIGDGGRIRQIITNILGNALKFTKEGHVLVDVGGDTQDGVATLNFAISDTGIGIAPDKLETIFEEFRQADNSTTRRFGGTGLGLSISKSFINLMGGELEVESELGTGSTFKFTIDLPVHKAEEMPRSSPVSQDDLSLLIVDDSSVNRDILSEMIRHWGWKCAAAPSAKAGLSALQKAYEKDIKIDLIILDYQMPNHDGKDFLAAMRKHSRFDHIPVIILSSVDSRELSVRLKRMGAAGFMTKPARSSALFDMINDTVHGATLKGVSESDKNALNRISQTLKTPPKGPTSWANEIDLLIAEDNEVNQMFARHAMDEFGHKYKIVENGALAVEKWKLLRPKLILMDISMPEMNGYEATQTIRDLEKAGGLPRTPIIAVTAHAMKDDKQKCLDAGMDDYLTKPLAVNALRTCLQKWLSKNAEMKQVG